MILEFICAKCGKSVEFEDKTGGKAFTPKHCMSCFIEAYQESMDTHQTPIALTADQVKEIKNRPTLPCVITKKKPKWIPGPPTKTGWCWLKYHNNKPFFQHVSSIREDMVFIDGGHHWTVKESISHHCPVIIQEPVDDN